MRSQLSPLIYPVSACGRGHSTHSCAWVGIDDADTGKHFRRAQKGNPVWGRISVAWFYESVYGEVNDSWREPILNPPFSTDPNRPFTDIPMPSRTKR